MLRLKRPADKRAEPAAAVLLVANALQMLDPILDCLDVAEHHGGARFQSELVRNLHYFQPLIAVDLQWRNLLPHSVDQNLTTAARDRAEAGVFKLRNHLPERHPERFGKMLKLRRTESVNIDVRILFADVPEKSDIPVEPQLRMMPPLHEDLNTAHGRKFVQLLIELFEREHVMIFIALGAVKRAEFAVNVANVRVIDVSIDNVGYNLAAAPVVAFRFGQIAPSICQRAQFLQGKAI